MTEQDQQQPSGHPTRNWRTSDWCPEAGVYWESWSRNGEVCLKGLDPPIYGGVRLASCLTWFLRSLAGECRRNHDMTKALEFTYVSPRTPTTLASKMWTSFALALRDHRLIRDRVRQRGGDPDACRRWPPFWLEGEAHDYVIGRDPFPPTGTLRRKLTLVGDERQVFVPARTAKAAAGVRRAWASGLDAVSSVDGAAFTGLLGEDEHAFLVNMLVLVHSRPAANPGPRPPLEESYRRHEGLIAELAPRAQEADLPVVWHALWRLPPAMTWSEPGAKPWMRYPAVSFVAAARSLRPAASRSPQ